jgi:hypothetical protein
MTRFSRLSAGACVRRHSRTLAQGNVPRIRVQRDQSEALHLRDGAANAGRARSTSPLELEPFSDQWLGWYEARRLFSEIDLLNDDDARRGIMPPLEARARKRRHESSGR